MPVADKKKVQTMVNIYAQQMQIIRTAVARMETVRNVFISVDPDVTGTALEGNVSAVNTAYLALKSETDKVLWTQLIAAEVPTHRNKALGDI